MVVSNYQTVLSKAPKAAGSYEAFPSSVQATGQKCTAGPKKLVVGSLKTIVGSLKNTKTTNYWLQTTNYELLVATTTIELSLLWAYSPKQTFTGGQNSRGRWPAAAARSRQLLPGRRRRRRWLFACTGGRHAGARAHPFSRRMRQPAGSLLPVQANNHLLLLLAGCRTALPQLPAAEP